MGAVSDDNATGKRDGKVNVQELLEFIFPKSLQHPLSTGRLYAFALYGPLDSNSELRSGYNGQRVVSTWEIDTMCLQFEREDILQVYISGGRPLFVLNDAQKEEVIAQADSHLKTAKGRGYRRQVTRGEVVDLLSTLPRDASGLVSFHDAQKLIMGYREKQIARFKVIFPEIAGGAASKQAGRASKSCAHGNIGGGGKTLDGDVGRGGGGDRSCALAETTVVGRAQAGKVLASTENMSTGCSGGGGAKRRGGRAKFSADVAPAEMFVKDMGHTPAGIANHTSKLLSTRAYKVSNIADGNNPGLTQNVKLIRDDRQPEQGQGMWDPYACLRGYNIGGHVRSARSSTTAKRKA
ncbi:unnamed protein product [Ectocarpus sp. 6 AP-2014]